MGFSDFVSNPNFINALAMGMASMGPDPNAAARTAKGIQSVTAMTQKNDALKRKRLKEEHTNAALARVMAPGFNGDFRALAGEFPLAHGPTLFTAMQGRQGMGLKADKLAQDKAWQEGYVGRMTALEQNKQRLIGDRMLRTRRPTGGGGAAIGGWSDFFARYAKEQGFDPNKATVKQLTSGRAAYREFASGPAKEKPGGLTDNQRLTQLRNLITARARIASNGALDDMAAGQLRNSNPNLYATLMKGGKDRGALLRILDSHIARLGGLKGTTSTGKGTPNFRNLWGGKK